MSQNHATNSINLTLSMYEPIPEEEKEVEQEKNQGEMKMRGEMKIYRLTQPIPSNENGEQKTTQTPDLKLEDVADSIQELRALTNRTLTDLISKNGHFESIKEQRYLQRLNQSLSVVDPANTHDVEEEDEEEEE